MRQMGSIPCLVSYWGKTLGKGGSLPYQRRGSREKRNLSWLHKQVRTPGMNCDWVGLVGSHMEAELQM